VSQRLKIAFVVTLVLVNVGLVILVRQKMADSRAESAMATPPAASATSTTPEPEPTSAPGGQQSLTLAADDDAIFRVYGGSCDGKETAGIAVSTDSGATFDDVGLPANMRTVFTLTAKDADTLDLVAAPQTCEPQRFVSTDGGSVWEAAEGADVWFLGPRNRVTAPVGVVKPGCTEALTLSAPTRNTGRVFCASGVLIGTTDAGESWTRLGTLDGVKAAAYVTSRQGFALAPDGGCATGSYSTDDAGRTWTAIGCLDAAPGRALAANADLVAAIAGEAVYLSRDGGRTWAKAS
jgi:photosystem II stability/assembly factor-like uncharacterized protein